jgi:hypothetical protein
MYIYIGPSFNLDQDIDRDIKLKVVDQALTMVKKTLYITYI